MDTHKYSQYYRYSEVDTKLLTTTYLLQYYPLLNGNKNTLLSIEYRIYADLWFKFKFLGQVDKHNTELQWTTSLAASVCA